jgi:hypothetical protein
MSDDVCSILHGIVDQQVAEGTFVPDKAAKLALDGVLALDGLVASQVPHTKVLVLDAMRQRAKGYLPSLNAATAAAARHVENGQSDFGELSMDFARLIRLPVGLDEMPGTVRLPPIEMNLPQLRQHCELVRTKARQNLEKAKLYELFIGQHPEWESAPELKLSQILNLEFEGAA